MMAVGVSKRVVNLNRARGWARKEERLLTAGIKMIERLHVSISKVLGVDI